MEQLWTVEHLRQIIHREQDPTPPKRQKVLPKDSKAYIRVATDLIARRGLYNALKPYREQYTWWQYHFLCHLVLSSTHDIALWRSCWCPYSLECLHQVAPQSDKR